MASHTPKAEPPIPSRYGPRIPERGDDPTRREDPYRAAAILGAPMYYMYEVEVSKTREERVPKQNDKSTAAWPSLARRPSRTVPTGAIRREIYMYMYEHLINDFRLESQRFYFFDNDGVLIKISFTTNNDLYALHSFNNDLYDVR